MNKCRVNLDFKIPNSVPPQPLLLNYMYKNQTGSALFSSSYLYNFDPKD